MDDRTACRRSARRPAHPRTFAAGGAALAQLWLLALGAGSADAADLPANRLVRAADPAGLLDGVPTLSDTATPALGHPAAPVEHLLHERIRSDDLPLPGQAAGVPDAFTIAAVLLPSVPPQARGDAESRASRSTTSVGVASAAGDRSEGATAEPAGSSTPPLSAAAVTTAEASAAATGRPVATGGLTGPAGPAGVVGSAGVVGRAGDEFGVGPDTGAAVSAVRPTELETAAAVLLPIVAGLLLTGAAAYKHRGLPRGH